MSILKNIFRRVNIFALVSGIIIIYITYTGEPWWVIRAIGVNPTFYANIAPYKIEINIMDRGVDIPILKYITLSGLLSYQYTGLKNLLGSVIPWRRIRKYFIGVSPIMAPLIMILTLYLALSMVNMNMGISIPIVGESTMILNIASDGPIIKVYTNTSSSFTPTYILSLVAGILGVIAKIIEGRLD